MEAILCYGGGAAVVLCVVLILAKSILPALGTDTYPLLVKLADKLPSPRILLLVQIFFLALMTVPLFFL